MGKDLLAPKPPFYVEGKVSFDKICSLLEISSDEIAKIMAVSTATVREGCISEKTLKKAAPLLHVLNMLWTIMEGDVNEVRRWVKEPRVEWVGLSPLDCLRMGKVKTVIEFLQKELGRGAFKLMMSRKVGSTT